MALAKSSRSRASGLISSGLVHQSNNAQVSGVQLADKLKIFKTDNFDPDAYVQSKCQTMNEKELYAKLNRMASMAADMFIGRERFATLLLMRLTETVILWLSEDQSFWDDIEEGPRTLGPLGIQQFYLDMRFVIQFGQGRFLSRHVHQVIIDIIDRAMAAFSATGMDPDSALPNDDWFIDIAQETISKISGKARIGNAERELHSPTASVSAQSISSIRSHGSS